MSNYTLDLAKLSKACKHSLEVTNIDEKGRPMAGAKLLLHSSCTLQRKGGGKPKTWWLTQDITPFVRQLVGNLRSNMGGSWDSGVVGGDLEIIHHGDSVSGWLTDTYRKATRVAKQIGENRAVRAIYEEVLPEVAPYIPYGSAALDISHKVARLVAEAREGYPEAKAKLAALKQSAASNPIAADALRMANNMSRILKTKQVRFAWDSDNDVEGWWYNRPYRPTTEALLDPGNPFTMARELYHRGREGGVKQPIELTDKIKEWF